MIIITEEQVSDLLNWNDTFRAVETAMLRVSQGRVVQKARVNTELLNSDNLLLTMPGYLEDKTYGALACKLVTMFKSNADMEKPLPTINANIMIFDETTGILKASIGGTQITKWRTAAASAVATKHIFSKNNKKCNVLAILGYGAQGRVHAEAFYNFFNFKEIRIWGRSVEKARLLVDELNKTLSTEAFRVAASGEECVREADVVITATYATAPIVQFEWVKAGAHINAVGCGTNHYNELDEQLYLNSDVYIDYWAGARDSLSGLEKLGVHFRGEVGDVIGGGLPIPAPDRITVFQSLGMAVEDGAMARLVFDLYQKRETEKQNVV
ncbi:ketimine reductase mu-crystallin [Anoplophora glabripennis]|uniref:ketimine reductase mu-crystallin n=1 Tax=Anoplophora glabripennis TaxID=217634 RepID=UPI000874F4DE|nr:ketimine reductase mu-crystallin [Anoplophora glabripennis]